jgi:hypothetical protein
MRQTSPNLCGPSAQPPPCLSSHSKFGPFCRLIQRRLGCRPARMRQTSPNLCGPSAQPRPCPTSHSKFGPFGRPIQRRFGCLPARMQQSSPICVALQLSLHLARRDIPNSDRFVADPETTRLPSCENATDLTQSVWPFSSASTLPVVTFQIRRNFPRAVLFTLLPSGNGIFEANIN